MGIIDHTDVFIKNLNRYKAEFKEEAIWHYGAFFQAYHGRDLDDDPTIYIKNLIVNNVIFRGLHFDTMNFSDCVFIDCSFEKIYFNYSVFKNCTFKSCYFREGSWGHSPFEYCEIEQSRLYGIDLRYARFLNTIVSNSHLENVKMGHSLYDNMTLTNCSIIDSEAENMSAEFPQQLIFKESTLVRIKFFNCKLNAVQFINCDFMNAEYVLCEITITTFSKSHADINYGPCTLDLQTILRSDIPAQILKEFFGVNDPSIKNYVREMVSKIDWYTVFVSYSFKDREFAVKMNAALMCRGIFTFLWEKDAPTGEPLKKIMFENIQKLDKVLFIASEKSLKSEACQFEITQARRKHKATFKNALFPIHIDTYLFEANEYDIPIEYLENIVQLRAINSKDFSQFASDVYIKEDFDKAIDNLVKDLRKKY